MAAAVSAQSAVSFRAEGEQSRPGATARFLASLGKTSSFGALAACALLAHAGFAFAADTLVDPTRNPLMGRGEDTASAAQPAPAPLRLQMILRGPGEIRTAVIDGSKVAVGDQVAANGGSARVERITDTTVVLARGGTKETLQLLPGAERAVRAASAAPKANGRPAVEKRSTE